MKDRRDVVLNMIDTLGGRDRARHPTQEGERPLPLLRPEERGGVT
ncbi:hypothetical protein GCM10018779_15510 [Streptomyces griseocarneus]|nr:hypothetical protein GCM10018779_15510 [Streptomyces griseocarneus]